jgi:formate hydrogenlyase subunit 6/NADH:ubiquinone oxidoreductase subunit I
MGTAAIITIDNRRTEVRQGASVLETADAAGIYIPRLCHHPDLTPGPGTRAEPRVYRDGQIFEGSAPQHAEYEGCGICVTEIEGRGPCLSCATAAEDGMVVRTDTAAVKELRRDRLARLFARHPHACLVCSEREGCDREGCTEGVNRQERCCSKFDDCEFQRVCAYVTIRQDVPQYIHSAARVVQTPLFTMDPDLCIECTRCVRACEKVQGKRVIGFAVHDGGLVVGTIGPSHKESGCVFCGACVSVCPTGALMDKGLPWKKKAQLSFSPVRLPPEDDLAFTEENVSKAPGTSGVFQLFDEEQNVICIRGTENMRAGLRELLQSVQNARFFRCEEHGMYTMRETEMLEAFLKKHGKLPEVNDEIADLY